MDSEHRQDRCLRCGGWSSAERKPLRFVACVCEVPTAWPWYQLECRACGESFGSALALAAYCPDKCRLRLRTDWITKAARVALYERDGWMCHICGDPVNRDAMVPELDAPTLDHVVARAVGGDHSPGNLKTAHFYCNSVKRELPLEEVA